MQTIHIQGLELPRLTLGTVQLGMAYGIANTIGKPDYEHSAGIMDAAMEGGITSFDTAAAYGDSELVLGRYFAALPADAPRPIITTKLKMGTDEPLGPEQTYDIVRQSVEGSLKRLGRNRVEVLMLHNAGDLINHGEAIVRAMERVRDEGLAERIGVSLYTAHEVDEVLRYGVFGAVQVPINIMDVRLTRSGALSRLKDAGMMVFVRSVFLQGLFFRDPETLPPYLTAAKPYLITLHQAARDEGLTMAQLAFGYVRDLPGVTSLVVGAETADQVRENLQLIEAPSISHETAQMLQKRFGDVPEQVLNPSFWK